MPNVGVELVNLLPPPFPEDVHVSVFNGNPPGEDGEGNPIEADVLRFDGKDFAFKRGEFETISPEAASFLFGIETRIANKLGTAMILHPDLRRECLVRYGAHSSNGRKWLNNFSFKLVKLSKRGGKESWGKMIPIAEL